MVWIFNHLTKSLTTDQKLMPSIDYNGILLGEFGYVDDIGTVKSCKTISIEIWLHVLTEWLVTKSFDNLAQLYLKLDFLQALNQLNRS